MSLRSKSVASLSAVIALAAPCFAASATPDSCRTLRLHGRAADATNCFELLTRSNDAYFRAEGYWGLEQFDQANEQFRIATSQPGSKPLYKVRWGRLFHDRFNDKEAVDLFHEALTADPNNAGAYVGLAIVSAGGFDGKATDYAQKAITLDPKLVEAHEVMAKLDLEAAEDPKKTNAEADQAIALAPDALDAYAIHATVELLADRPPDAWFAKINAINPAYGEAYALVAENLVLNRRYEDGVAYFRKAIAVEPRLWSAHEQLGIINA